MVAALILSAGLGTRLAPLSHWRAKPLVPIGDRPAIAFILAQVQGVCGVTVVNAHHRADDVEAYARAAGVAVSREAELLGTAGGLARAGEFLGAGDVLVWNGDMIGELDVRALVEAHVRAADRGALATLVVRARGDGAGNTGLDAQGDVMRLRHEAARAGESRSADFLGVYVVTDALRRGLPPRGDIIAESFLPALHRGGKVASFVTDAALLDVGTPRAYLDANLRWLAATGRDAWIGDGARVEPGVILDRVVVGAGARVVGTGRLEGCVVWPGAEARAPLTSAVVTVDGTVAVAPPP